VAGAAAILLFFLRVKKPPLLSPRQDLAFDPKHYDYDEAKISNVKRVSTPSGSCMHLMFKN